jgi:hypothetical protein
MGGGELALAQRLPPLAAGEEDGEKKQEDRPHAGNLT